MTKIRSIIIIGLGNTSLNSRKPGSRSKLSVPQQACLSPKTSIICQPSRVPSALSRSDNSGMQGQNYSKEKMHWPNVKQPSLLEPNPFAGCIFCSRRKLRPMKRSQTPPPHSQMKVLLLLLRLLFHQMHPGNKFLEIRWTKWLVVKRKGKFKKWMELHNNSNLMIQATKSNRRKHTLLTCSISISSSNVTMGTVSIKARPSLIMVVATVMETKENHLLLRRLRLSAEETTKSLQQLWKKKTMEVTLLHRKATVSSTLARQEDYTRQRWTSSVLKALAEQQEVRDKNLV